MTLLGAAAVAVVVVVVVLAGLGVFAWRRWREDPLTKGRRAIRAARRHSDWLKVRPFSDRYDH
jgi:hypothetical protein